MRRMAGVVLGALIAASVLAPPARGQLLYDNGGPSGAGSSGLNAWVQADDFTLLSAATIGGIRFWGAQVGAADPDSVFRWEILRDSAGAPRVSLASGTAPWERTDPGTLEDPQYTTYAYDLQIDSLTLAAGSYWLSLHYGSLGQSSLDPWLGWAWAAQNDSQPSVTDSVPFDGHYFQSGEARDLAFQLYGPGGVPAPPPPPSTIPEPATLLLLGSSLAVMAAVLRRRCPPRTDR